MSQQSLSSPCMSDKTLLVSVEDLISLAMGRSDSNTVDFKMVQTILHILARQMRVLEQKVVLVSAEIPEPRMRGRSRGRAKSKNISGTTAGEGEREEDVEYGGERPRSSSRSGRRRQRSRDQGGGRGRRSWEDDTTTSTSADQRARADRGREMDDRAGGRGGRDDDGRGGRDRAGGGRGGSDRDDDGRGGRDRAGGGRGGSDRDDEGRGGRDRAGGGRGGSDRDDDGKGGRDRAGGGRGGSDIDDDGRGGRDRAGGGTGGLDRDDDGRGGRDRAGGGRGGSDRDHDSRGGPDRDDDGRGGHDRSGGGRGGKYDDGRGGGLVGTDYDDGGRGGLDSDVGGKGGRDYDEGGKGGAGKGGKHGGGAGAISGIGIREIDGPGKEKLLVVEKGPTTVGGGRERRDSIAVVTQSQFVLLEQAVEELKQLAGPLPSPVMPDNRQLRKDVAAGASLTDTMQAMQVSARVKAAEEAIGKMGELLTQLAVSGALPPDAAGAALAGGWTQDADGEQSQQIVPAMSYKSVVIDPSEKGADDGPGSGQVGQIGAERRPATPGATSFTIHAASAKRVTEPEMADAIKMLREEMKKSLQDQIERAATAAETALNTAKGIVGKVEELLKMDSRISAMHSMVNDYTEQLNGFDAGLTTQLASFNEQMEIMRSDLAKGMAQLQVANSNPETVAVMELNERFEGLVRGLDDTLLLHTSLTNMQNQLTLELKALMEAVEELREQKADRDELVDSLRDKADNWRLEGLVTQEEFERLKTDLQQRMEKTSAKFQKQDEIWTEAIRDLTELARTKAQVMELFKLRDETTAQLRNIDERISRLALILGEPKAAMLMRKLARDAVCASCLTPAMMDPGGEPRPPLLPAARGAPPEPCVPEPTPPPQPDFRTHKCHRWVGGSHTLLPAARAHAAPLPVLPDVINKYTGYGNDGRLYWMESEMQPCVECNPEAPAPPGTERSDAGGGGGGGDGGDAGDAGDADLLPGDFCECP